MKRRRHTPDQVIRKLAEGDKLLAEGKTSTRLPPSRDHRIDLAPLEEPVRRHEGDDAKSSKELERRTSAEEASWPTRCSTWTC